MFETISDSQMMEKITSIIDHLVIESKYLDSVIESSLEIQSLLRDRQSFPSVSLSQSSTQSESNGTPTINPTPAPSPAAQADPSQKTAQRLTEIREQLAREFLPVMKGRQVMLETMNSIDAKQKQTPSVTALTLKVDEPLRSQLKQLRNEIRSKLHKVQSIAMGNQAILLYTMDFYNRLLNGLSRDQRPSNYYNATGKTQNHFSVNLIETNC